MIVDTFGSVLGSFYSSFMLCFWIRGDKHSDMCAFHKRSKSQYLFVTLLWLVGLLTFLQWRCLVSHDKRSISSQLGFTDSKFEIIYTSISLPTFTRYSHTWIFVAVINGWEPGKIQPTAHYIQPTKQTALLEGKNTCPKDPLPKALIIVHSEAENREQRLAIRNTWAMDISSNHNISVIFFLGLSEDELVNVSCRDLVYLYWKDFFERVFVLESSTDRESRI